MKKLATLALLFSLSVFGLGCEPKPATTEPAAPAESEPAPANETPAAEEPAAPSDNS